MPVGAHVVLGERQQLAGGDAQLQLDEVEAGDGLGDRVLDLQAGVHLQEVELAGGVVEQELDGAGPRVADLAGQGHRGLVQPRAGGVVDGGRGRLLQHLLVPALGRAVALAEMQHGAVRVGHHLHLDVAPGLDVLLHEHGVVAERRPRLALRRGHRLVHLRGGAHDAHALAAATRRGLDQHRERGVVTGRHDGDAGGHRHLPGGVLAPHQLHHLGPRTRQRDAGLGQRPRERRALGEEAVAGVDDVGTGGESSAHDGVDVEVAGHEHGVVGGPHVRRVGVELGEDRDGAQPHLARGAYDAESDLATVGDQDGPESHRHHILKMP